MLGKFFSKGQSIVRYYWSWTAIVAFLGLLFSSSAFFLPSNGWFLIIVSNLFFLFLIGHTARKADESIKLVAELSQELQVYRTRNNERLSVVRKGSRRALKLARRNLRFSKKMKLAPLGKQYSEGEVNSNGEAHSLLDEKIDKTQRQLLNALKNSNSSLSKKIGEARKDAEFALQVVRCVDTRYSLYLRSHPVLKLQSSSLANAFFPEGVSTSNLNALVKPYCDMGIFSEETIRHVRESKEVILVHQMGKVGSEGIYASLKRLDMATKVPVLHTHTLSRENVYTILYNHLLNASDKGVGTMQLLASLIVCNELDTNFHSKRWKVITLTRDPIARNISAFFQILDLETSFRESLQSNSISRVEIESAVELFLDTFPHNVPLRWFESDIQSVFGIDVFSKEFSRDKGFAIYSEESVDLMVIRLESLNNCYIDAFEQFLNIENFDLQSKNQASDKAYKEIYKEFIGRISFPEDYIQEMYSSKYARHFYSPEELKEFMKRWST